MSKHDLEAIRKKLAEKNAAGKRDPHEFVPPKAKPGADINFRFYILPPLQEGDKTVDGVASRTMEVYYVENGAHWFNKRPFSCPRVHDGGTCNMCGYGFELMKEVEGSGPEAKKAKSAIARVYLPPQKYAINIYFPNDSTNPEELRGKVMWFNTSKTVIDIGEKVLMADGEGDENDPTAFGVFYDEENACLFQLNVKEKGGYNNYEGSKFLPKVKRPIFGTKGADGVIAPDPAKIKQILDIRHDLYTKFDPPDTEKLDKLLDGIVNKTGGTVGGSNGGFDSVEERPASTPKSTTSTVVSEDLAGEGGNAPPPKTEKKTAAKSTVTKAAAPVTPVAAAPIQAPSSGTDDEAELQDLLTQLNAEG